MKYRSLIYFLLVLTLFSCRNDTDKLYELLPIVKEYEPEYYIFDGDEISKEEWLEMENLRFIINSEDEFPEEDLMGLEEIKDSNIDFQKYTLLLCYYKIPGVVLNQVYLYAKDLVFDSLIFSMNFLLDRDLQDNPETENLFAYCRCAILVSKIPEGTEVVFRLHY